MVPRSNTSSVCEHGTQSINSHYCKKVAAGTKSVVEVVTVRQAMGWVDAIPRAGRLYIGGLHALYQKPDLFQRAGITHILSVLDFSIYEAGHFKDYKHLHIKLDDDPNENLLQYFNKSNEFINNALINGGAVFIHCAMGKSRSATVCCAFLMWRDKKSPLQALSQICEGRPVCSPNPGFMEQLEVYSHMLKANHESESTKIYEDWLKERYTGKIMVERMFRMSETVADLLV